ncbi:MAG: sigma-70 family RNA polymerase sigma factor [Planctomycetota bacterium]
MKDRYTTLGAGGGEFPPTSWSMVVNLKTDEDRARGLEQLCARYWKPIYCYVRRALRKTNEDAKDLTQSFFIWLLDGNVLERYDAEQATFRLYLKGLLRNYARNHEQSLRRLKRGGATTHVPISDDEVTGLEALLADPRAESPEDAFDRAWVEDLLDTGLERTREWLRDNGHTLRLQVYEAYELAEAGEQPTYTSVAEALGIKVSDVRNHLYAARERLRAEIRAQLRETVASNEQLEEEWQVVFG